MWWWAGGKKSTQRTTLVYKYCSAFVVFCLRYRLFFPVWCCRVSSQNASMSSPYTLFAGADFFLASCTLSEENVCGYFSPAFFPCASIFHSHWIWILFASQDKWFVLVSQFSVKYFRFDFFTGRTFSRPSIQCWLCYAGALGWSNSNLQAHTGDVIKRKCVKEKYLLFGCWDEILRKTPHHHHLNRRPFAPGNSTTFKVVRKFIKFSSSHHNSQHSAKCENFFCGKIELSLSWK